jgi:ABC-2 type transport system permease protein
VSDWAIIRLIAKREITERIQGRTTRVMTIVTALLVVAGVTVPALTKSSPAATRIGLVGPQAQALAPVVERSAHAAKANVAVRAAGAAGTARKELLSGRLDVALDLGRAPVLLEVRKSLDPTIRAVLQEALDGAHLRHTLERSRIPLSTVLPALEPVPTRTVALAPPPPQKAARSVAAIAAGLLMYISLMMYGGAVATGVAQEKTSRTAEVLLASVRPHQLLTGKVLGIGATGLAQLTIAAAAGLIANAFVHSAKIPGAVIALIPAFLVFFLVGFVLYAFMFAAAGALVARQEEVQAVTTPLAMPLLIGYLLTYAAIGRPDATWLKVLSYLPPMNATLMPTRIALGHVAWWELPVQTVIMLASVYAVARLASRVYSGALIHGGARLGWQAALRLSGRSAPAQPLRSP